MYFLTVYKLQMLFVVAVRGLSCSLQACAFVTMIHSKLRTYLLNLLIIFILRSKLAILTGRCLAYVK